MIKMMRISSQTETAGMTLYDHITLDKVMPIVGSRGAMFMQNAINMDEGASITNMPIPGALPDGCEFLLEYLKIEFVSDNARLSNKEECDNMRVISSGGWFELHIMSKVYAIDTLRTLATGFSVSPPLLIASQRNFGLSVRWKEYPALSALDICYPRDMLRVDFKGHYLRPAC